MNQEDRTKIVTNYYRAIHAIIDIGTMDNVSEELKQLTFDASSATMKIIDYVNSHRD